MQQTIYLITGLMASGKSTIAQMLAERLEKAVHLRGDVFRRMMITGRADMSASPTPQALDQLYLRYRLTASAAKMYANQGFTVVIQDNYYGPALRYMIDLLDGCLLRVVVLCPDVNTIRERENRRGKIGYTGFDIEPLYDSFLKETPHIGYWLDNSAMMPQETVNCILQHADWD